MVEVVEAHHQVALAVQEDLEHDLQEGAVAAVLLHASEGEVGVDLDPQEVVEEGEVHHLEDEVGEEA